MQGFSRLRVMRYRVIFRERMEEGERVIDCFIAEERNVVYELFAQMLRAQIGAED